MIKSVQSINFGRVAPGLAVSDIQAAYAFYAEVLGFRNVFENGKPVGFMMLKKDAAEIHLSQSRDTRPIRVNSFHMFFDDISGLYAICEAAKVRIINSLQEKSYGQLAFVSLILTAIALTSAKPGSLRMTGPTLTADSASEGLSRVRSGSKAEISVGAPSRPPTSRLAPAPVRASLAAMDIAVPTLALRRLAKIAHTVAAAGFMGGMTALAVVVLGASGAVGGAGYGALVGVMAKVAAWVVGPSMVLTVVSGLLAMLANPAFYEAGWVWLKALTGVVVLEGGLHVLGPLQDEAKRAAGAIAAASDPAGVARLLSAEWNTLWVLVAVSVANIVLGVWRPRFSTASD